MNKLVPGLAAMAVLATIASAAPAQAEDRPIEIGGGAGIAGSWWAGPFQGGDVRISWPANDRIDVETIVGSTVTRSGQTTGFYGVQARQRLRSEPTATPLPFVTFGGLGVIYHGQGHIGVTPPLFGLVGGGVEHRVAPRLALRVEAQGIFVLVLPVGVRVAAGVSIPIGHVSR